MKRTDEPVGIVPGLSGRVRALAILAALVLITPPLMALQWLFVRWWPEGARQLPHRYHRLVARILGMQVILRGAPPEPGPCLIAANHCSWLDIVALSAVAPLSFIAKSEVASWPIFGTFARLQRTVFVDRQRRATVGASRDDIRERLLQGDRLVLFPEGTSTDGMRVLPFKSALLAAANTEVEGQPVPVQPLTIVYTGYRGVLMDRWLRPAFTWYGDMELAPHLWRVLQLGPFEVTVELHEALTLATVGSRKALARAAEDRVRAGLMRALTGLDRSHSSASRLDPRPVPVEVDQTVPAAGKPLWKET